jgi:peptidoglycan/LPS O-acetylase OafA/YrhL
MGRRRFVFRNLRVSNYRNTTRLDRFSTLLPQLLHSKSNSHLAPLLRFADICICAVALASTNIARTHLFPVPPVAILFAIPSKFLRPLVWNWAGRRYVVACDRRTILSGLATCYPAAAAQVSSRSFDWRSSVIARASHIGTLAQWLGAGPTILYTHTIFRLDSICAGALFAVWIRTGQFSRERASKISAALVCTGLIACAATLWRWPASPASANLRFSALATFSFGLLGCALLAEPKSFLCRSLTPSWLCYIGKISFGLYLLHVTVFDTLTPERLAFLGAGWLKSIAVLTIDFAAAFVLASCSWRFFESPILTLKHRFEYGRQVAPYSR